jgi:LuxR family maltose regulon positive regulatory protein
MSESVLSSITGKQETSQSACEQQESLLETKLFIPPTRRKQVSRPRLMERLNQGLDKALILVSAPAGYGKTTLVSSWLREANLPSCWVSLDENDNDLRRFLEYFVAALQKIIPALQADVHGMLSGMQPAPMDTLVNLLINEIAEHAIPFVLVLDDFHLIQAQPILEMVTFLLEHIPAQMHLVLLTRTDPPFPLSRLRARNQLKEIRAEHLRFTPGETAIFLNEVMELKLHAGDLTALEERTEGWIAGLQLAALSMQRTTNLHSFISDFAGSHRYMMDYLAEEVLQLQPESMRSFLLKTSILDRMNGSLCDAVMNGEGAASFNGQATLEFLEQMNLFVIPLDNEKRWYRYHHLFADVLNRYLEKQFPDQLRELHGRAAQWYAQNGFISEALRHSLAAGDQDFAVQLIEQNGCMLMMRGEVVTLLKWIEAVEPYSATRPWIAILSAWAYALTGQLERVEPLLESVNRSVTSSAPSLRMKIMLGSMVAARAYIANLHRNPSQAVDFARQALDYLPGRVPFSQSLRSLTTSILGDASWINGDLETAKRAYIEAVQIARSARNIHMAIIANSNIAEILIEQGQLRQAARVYTETLPMAQNSPLAARIHAGLCKVSYEWNRLEEATNHAQLCIELGRQWESPDFQFVGYVMLALLERAGGHPDKAEAAISVAEELTGEPALPERRSNRVKSALAHIWFSQGNLDRVSSLLQENKIRIEGEIPYLQEAEYLILLRLLLSQGDYENALHLSKRLLLKAEETNRMGQVIQVLILQALAFQGKSDLDQALSVLARALSLARPERYVRIFADEGVPMAKLLHRARADGIESSYTAEILSTMGESLSSAQSSAQTLIVPLTTRELEVLRLIEAGCSNQNIADKLVISIATVKRHISNIYIKLGAKSRTQAVSLAKELKLFEQKEM